MSSETGRLTRQRMLDYFLGGAVPRSRFMVGMELEKMGREAAGGRPIRHDGEGPTVRRVLEFFREQRGGDPVFEGNHLIGLSATWGTLTLEPGGQLEWSSRPHPTLERLRTDLEGHLDLLEQVGKQMGIDWLDIAVDPVLPVSEMTWMPKARYKIMRSYLGSRGRLAHRMMTQTASIQCAFDYADAEDWKRKFKASALLAPVATALFANSSRVDGKDSGYRSYRQAIWRETDPDRCGLPEVVFRPDFDVEVWLDWILSVPTIFRHRGRGLVPTGGVPFRQLLDLGGCDAVESEDWETHASTIFTEVRSYSYIEVRSADLQPNDLAFAVPTFWTGILYDDDGLDAVLDLCSEFDDHASWTRAMETAAREGLSARSIGAIAARALAISARGLRRGAACVGDPQNAAEPLEALAARQGVEVEI